MDIMGKTNYGKSRITGKKDHWWNETHAECTKCKKVFKHSDFHGRSGRGKRPVAPTCKPCTSDIEFAKRRKDIVLTKYKNYKSIMRSEGNDCDLTLEEFRNIWPKDDKCPILGYTMKLYPIEERGEWKGGRHYPYTPTIDHVDPRQPLSKDNFWVISWRANEIKSDTIPCEVALLNHALIRLKGGVINNFFLQKEAALQQLDSAQWLGKYSDDRKL
tara:strand:- start:58 stop:705 length:648 start_codon:yes stop_codon:yes gene_type:complete